jgi:ERCC4-type nuclease
MTLRLLRKYCALDSAGVELLKEAVTNLSLSARAYCIDGAVLIERKTAADFAQWLIDGRLFGKAKQMASSSLRPAYIIEGTSAEWSVLGVSREALQGAMVGPPA